MSNKRLNYEDSCRRLQRDYLDPGSIPPMPDALPKYDDPEPIGVSFFRTFVGEGDNLSNLTLPRTFFCRSEINDASFQNTDFKESNLCWNDFINVDFTDAVLAHSDMRASMFTYVKFSRADLRNSDLRRSSFKDCDFEGALMAGAVLTYNQGKVINLTEDQKARIEWTDDDGSEPGGG